MSNDLVQELNEKTKSQKFLKVEILFYDSGAVHAMCSCYEPEGPFNKLMSWRIEAKELLQLAPKGRLDGLQDFFSWYDKFLEKHSSEEIPKQKPQKVAKYTLEVDNRGGFDADYVQYEPFGNRGKLKPTRKGYTEFFTHIKDHAGDAAMHLETFTKNS